MVIYFILAILFALLCTFLVILYQVNILPMRQQIKDIIHSKQNNFESHYIPPPSQTTLSESIVVPQNQESTTAFLLKTRIGDIHDNMTITTNKKHTTNKKTFKILDVFLDVDEDLTTMIFKIPSENFINGIHIIHEKFIFTIVIIHKDNSDNISSIKSKINSELDNLHNIYSYENNTVCIFNNNIILIESCGVVEMNNNLYLIPFNTNTIDDVKLNHHNRFYGHLNNDEQEQNHSIITESQTTSATAPSLPPTALEIPSTCAHLTAVASENNKQHNDEDLVNHGNTHSNLDYRPQTIVFQNNKETGFTLSQTNTSFKKNLKTNSTLNMLSNLKNTLF